MRIMWTFWHRRQRALITYMPEKRASRGPIVFRLPQVWRIPEKQEDSTNSHWRKPWLHGQIFGKELKDQERMERHIPKSKWKHLPAKKTAPSNAILWEIKTFKNKQKLRNRLAKQFKLKKDSTAYYLQDFESINSDTKTEEG